MERFAEFVERDYLNFQSHSPEQDAVDQLRGMLVRAARAAARKVHQRQFDDEGFDIDVVAMALAAKLLEQADVPAMFAPTRPAASG